YAGTILLNLGMLAAGLLGLALAPTFWLQLLDAAFLAVVFTQLAFISHDSGHHQICRTASRNELICLLHSNLLLGMSGGWWVWKHNQHHAHPNLIDLDPDLDLPSMAASVELARRKKGFWRLVMKYQAYLFLPSLAMMAWGLRAQSIRAVLRKTV